MPVSKNEYPRGVRSDRRVTTMETVEMPVHPRESSQSRAVYHASSKAINVVELTLWKLLKC